MQFPASDSFRYSCGGLASEGHLGENSGQSLGVKSAQMDKSARIE